MSVNSMNAAAVCKDTAGKKRTATGGSTPRGKANAAKTDFLSRMTHDIRTRLMA
ncbi:MAG: hypothetical protein ACLRMX_03985 [Lachnospira eligens]